MSLKNLDNLVKTGQLKLESFNKQEFAGMVTSGKARLKDAENQTLSLESRFDLAYGAAHALSLAALRWHGYRSNHRYIVFQVLPYTLGLSSEMCRILSKCHDRRNLAEYEGHLEVEEQLLKDLIKVTHNVLANLTQYAENI